MFLAKKEEKTQIDDKSKDILPSKVTLNNNFVDELKENAINDTSKLKNKNQDFNKTIDLKFSESLVKQENNKKINLAFTFKEIFDRIGYGFAANQYILIFLFLIGAPIYLVGILNGVKDVLSTLISFIIKKYHKFKQLNSGFTSTTGIVFGFSFLVIAFSIKSKLVWLFSLAFLLGSLGVVIYGEVYQSLLENTLKQEKRSSFLKKVSYKGLSITAVCFFFSGIILQYFGMNGRTLNFLLFGWSFSFVVNGYLLVFEIATFAFILSAHILSKIPPSKITFSAVAPHSFIKSSLQDLSLQINSFMHNKKVKLMLFSAVLIALIQSLGNSYYGFYMYDYFKDFIFGGFINIAFIFIIALFASFFGPYFAKLFKRTFGLTPMILFSILLIAILPLTLIYNMNFFVVVIAQSLCLIGASILGVSQSLLARNILNEDERRLFFDSLGISTIIPFLIFIPLGSLLAHYFGFIALFKAIIIILILILVPISLRLIYLNEKQTL